MTATVDGKLCPQDHPCPAAQVCPYDALTQEGDAAPVVDEEKCEDCGLCVKACPKGALRIE
ncbi:MAG: ATP-binding protein [Planctomycetota bacterium]